MKGKNQTRNFILKPNILYDWFIIEQAYNLILCIGNISSLKVIGLN